jgi:hypothetical protein
MQGLAHGLKQPGATTDPSDMSKSRGLGNFRHITHPKQQLLLLSFSHHLERSTALLAIFTSKHQQKACCAKLQALDMVVMAKNQVTASSSIVISFSANWYIPSAESNYECDITLLPSSNKRAWRLEPGLWSNTPNGTQQRRDAAVDAEGVQFAWVEAGHDAGSIDEVVYHDEQLAELQIHGNVTV